MIVNMIAIAQKVPDPLVEVTHILTVEIVMVGTAVVGTAMAGMMRTVPGLMGEDLEVAVPGILDL